jgi:DNA repair protein RadA/Sms
VVFGEVGLAGEVRPVQRGQERLREAAKLGFTHAIVPKANKPKQRVEGLTIVSVERVGEAVEYCRGG